MSEKQKNLFEQLKEIRLEKKLTLKQISQSTRIHLKYLEFLEKGDLLQIPEIYDKLFFKSYLKALDAAESEFYDQFLEFRKTIRDDRTSILDMTQTDSQVEKEFNFKNILYFVPILIAILVLWFLISNTLMVDDADTEAVREVSVLEVAQNIQSKIDSAKSAQSEINEDSLVTEQSEGLNLNILAVEKTWFRIIIDGKDTSEYLLQRGQNVSFASRKYFDFLIGKANGLKINVKNKTFGPFGDENQIVKFMRIDSSGIVNKIVSYPLNKNGNINEDI